VGSKLPVLAAIQVMLLAATASADQAGDLFKQGIELYKQGKYPEAVTALAKSYKLEAKPDALFALAQAERLAGNCDAAVKHYRKMLDSSTDLNTAKLVETNLALCETINGVDKKKDESKPAPLEPKVVVKTVPHTDKLATTMFAGGMLGLGAAGGLYIASRTARTDAGRARTFDDYQSLSDRADRDQLMSFVVGGVSAALIGVAVFKWTRSPKEDAATVSVTPTASSATVTVTGRW
jgi:tetratricopeptide (TPR) repeat protein